MKRNFLSFFSVQSSRLKRNTRGASVGSVALGSFLLLLVLASYGDNLVSTLTGLFVANNAQIHDNVSNAAYVYARANYQAVETNAAAGAYEITVDQLVSAGNLSSSDVDSSGVRDEVYNSAGARHITLGRDTGAGGLEIITYTLGGTPFTELELSDALNVLGTRGGIVQTGSDCNSTDTLCARGLGENWYINLGDYDNAATTSLLPSGGEVISKVYVGQGDAHGPELYRSAITGRPELNRMATNLDGGSNDIFDFTEFRPVGTADGAGLDSTNMATLEQFATDHASGEASVPATASSVVIRDADSTIFTATPKADDHAATKAYVDAQAGGGSGPCGSDPQFGEVCSDTTIFVGYDYDGKAMMINPAEPIVTMDAFPNGVGSNLAHMEDVLEDCIARAEGCNGELNTAMIVAFRPGSAAAECANRVSLGYDDWYLPMYREFLSIMVSGAGTGVDQLGDTNTGHWWTSTIAVDNSDNIYPYFIDKQAGGQINRGFPRYTDGSTTSGGLIYNVICIRRE